MVARATGLEGTADLQSAAGNVGGRRPPTGCSRRTPTHAADPLPPVTIFWSRVTGLLSKQPSRSVRLLRRIQETAVRDSRCVYCLLAAIDLYWVHYSRPVPINELVQSSSRLQTRSSPMTRTDFSEVGHTGGKVTFTVTCDEAGRASYQIGYSHSSPRPATLVGVYAHPDGFACGNIVMGGIGDSWNPPPFPDAIAVLMASDSQGKFGHECPRCKRHFRTDGIPSRFPLNCPYCGLRTAAYKFLTPPQKSYISHYTHSLQSALAELQPGEKRDVVIDMDAMADTVTDEPRADFYYTSTTQQTEFRCSACNSYNDIRGRYGYCAFCGWRNTAESQRAELTTIREQLVNGALAASDAVKQSVSAFDSSARDYTDQLVSRVPMKTSRRHQLMELLFHNLQKFDDLLRSCFDIDLLHGMAGDRGFVSMMFLRRHVYEHDGGVATRRYVTGCDDRDVQEGMLIRESVENVHRFIGCLNRMITTFERDFHEIFSPVPFCIDIENERRKRLAKRNV